VRIQLLAGKIPPELADVAAVMQLCEALHCSPFDLPRLPLRWIEGALMILQARRELEELEMRKLRRRYGS
jgi:hypothetical protein